ncbi:MULTISPECIES: tyrosinase family protein [unclassified Bradyrhizobium]|uniref:tyrosinase family protein n=1 Tax=unclassified Bradyrhizobium TaxID=2631580 RepID=UPI0028EAF5D2|nr:MULTISPECIES: tyrosinase family protein [unclassified Bradyrhizobium]
MSMRLRQTRRTFLATAAMAAASTVISPRPSRAAAKYRRYNVTSAEGQKMLASYAKGVAAMLQLPANHPQNWFRNAFIHLMDCPHGNWWFYVWHRGYLGYFEQSIRALSGDESFALPYWDWTELPEIPAGMFDAVLTPTDRAYQPFTANLAVFTSFIKPALTDYWNGLSKDQRGQLEIRGYKSIDDLWNDVTGFSSSANAGISGNEAFATTCASRYLSRDNPKLDAKTAYDVSPFVIMAGLLPTDFYNVDNYLSFTSSKTASHNTQPNGATKFSTLEGLPHNKVHNYIGGVGPLDPGPYGNMTNFLSPVDPIFFLHHSNMDRLWDVWTRKQQRLKLPYLPQGADLKTFSDEPFLFYADGKGGYVGPSKAGDYISTDRFDYDYAPGFGEDIVNPPAVASAPQAKPQQGSVKANVGTVRIPGDALEAHLAAARPQPLMAQITLPRPSGYSTVREFDVLVNAPANVAKVTADSPYYAGTIAFFGSMMPGMAMTMDATFAVPLPTKREAFSALRAAPNQPLSIRVVPSGGVGTAPTLKALSVGPLRP